MKKLLTAATLAGSLLFVGGMMTEAKSFKDVPDTHAYYTEIEEMKELNIISGYEDRSFRPTQAILRKHVASLIYKSMTLEQVRPATDFADVPKTSSYYPMIQALYQAGIVDGDVKNGKRYYNPDATLTRAQMAKMLSLAYDLELKGTANFSDVKTSDWSYDYINRLYSNNITTGNNGRFLPGNQVTRQHFSVFMYRTLGEKSALSLQGQAAYLLEKWLETGVAYAPASYIPTDIARGEYAFIPPNDDLMYFAEELTNGEILDNEIFDSFGYVYVQGRGNVITDGILVPLEVLEAAGYPGVKSFYAALQNVKTYTGDGMYKIGTDLPAGTYTFTSTEEGAYVSLNSGPVGNGDIVTNNIFTGRYQLTVQDGQYVFVSGAQIQ